MSHQPTGQYLHRCQHGLYRSRRQMADIVAMQNLYGVTAIRTGDNTHGEQTNARPRLFADRRDAARP